MGKNKPVKKASKTAVKVGNKKQNKVNKSKKNRSASKSKVASNKVRAWIQGTILWILSNNDPSFVKANNLSLHKQRQEAEAQEDAYDEAQTADVVQTNKFVG